MMCVSVRVGVCLCRLLCACRRVATHKPTPINLGPDLKGATADTLAEMLLPSTQGFSGRELSKLTLTVQVGVAFKFKFSVCSAVLHDHIQVHIRVI